MKKLRIKLEEMSAGILLIGSILYLYGQFGNLELHTISLRQFIFRTGAAIIVLALTAVFINRHYIDGEWQ